MATESPSLLLQRAADKLAELAEEASPPAWRAVDLSGAGHAGVWWVKSEYEDEEYSSSHCVAELETVNPRADATWIAVMSPAIAAPLVAWLRSQAQFIKRQWYPGSPSYEPWPVVQFARLILGEPRKD